MWTVCLLLALTMGAVAAEVLPQDFSCAGDMIGGACRLSDARFYATASWHFTGISPGVWTLVLEGIATDPCPGCDYGRDLYVQVFWRSSPLETWNWRFVLLRNMTLGASPAAYAVRGELPLRLNHSELWVLVRRYVLCDPWVSFAAASLKLWSPEAEFVARPPSPEIPPPPPPPVPSVQDCAVGPLWSCNVGLPPEGCLSLSPGLASLARSELPETLGPGDATVLERGHYRGTMRGDDWQDWYRFSAAKGEAVLVYFEPEGDLVVDVYLVHDPCGTNLAWCLNVSGPTTLEAPCEAGLQCVTIPDGLTECFIGERCGFFLRIVHLSGSGSYKVSLIPAKPAPL